MVAVGFHDIHEIHPSPITTEALDRIGALYGIEREIRGQTAEQRREIRQARAKPLLDQFHRWLEEKLTTLSAKSDTAAAIQGLFPPPALPGFSGTTSPSAICVRRCWPSRVHR